MHLKLVCKNCNRRFWSDELFCPYCGWDRHAVEDVIEDDIIGSDDQEQPEFDELDDMEPDELEALAYKLGIVLSVDTKPSEVCDLIKEHLRS